MKAILEASLTGGAKLGDFSLKDLKDRLASYGLDYNPVPLLYSLERAYMAIRTSYRSSNQHWWVIVKRREIEDAVAEYEGRPESGSSADYRVRLLRIQFYSINPQSLFAELKAAERRGDRSIVAKEAFERLPKIVGFLESAKEYRQALSSEIELAEQILDLAERLVMSQQRVSKTHYVGEAEVDYNPARRGL